MGDTNAGIDNKRKLSSLKDEQQVRQRPWVIFGTNDEKGALVSIFEIVANSVDEAREGFGNSIRMSVDEGNVITIDDDGRGLPMGWNEDEQAYNWELALCRLYASGKYDDMQYSQAVGLNGLGLTSTQYASEFMDVWSTYDNHTFHVHCEKGVPIGGMEILEPIREGTGTKIRFKPDPEIFPALKLRALTADMFLQELRRKAMLLSKKEIIFSHYELTNPVRLYYDNGPVEYLDALASKRMLSSTVEFGDSAVGTDDAELYPEEYKVDMKIAFNFSREANITEVYHNTSYLFARGETVDGLERGITQAFTDYARSSGKLSSKDRFVYRDISDILLCVATTDAPGNRTWFENQTKGAITNPFIGKSFMNFVYSKFRYWLDNNANIANKVLQEVLTNKQAREEGAEVSKKVIKSLTKAVGFGNKPKGFKDCSSNIISERELYFVEGRSALTSVKTACNPKFQAVMPLRGKIINCLKEKLTKVFNNEIIIDTFRVLGCGVEVKSEYIQDLPKFDISKLKWSRLLICTDADVDGMHIRCLMITMFYILAPSLLKEGKVFIVETPLYEISYKDEIQFAYNDKEKEVILEEFKKRGIKESSINVARSKGLGENDADMMSRTTMNPVTRRLIPVEYPENDSDLYDYFNVLLGNDIETRRLLIEEYFDITDEESA